MSRLERAAMVREIRKSLGLSQQELADGLHLKSRGTITRWESGTVEVTDDKLHHLKLFASLFKAVAEIVEP